MEKLKLHSPDFTQENIAKLAELFPNCIAESTDEKGTIKRAIDFDQLRQELSSSIVEGNQERYQLNWPGKREALLTANAPIAKTLRPCREESVDFDTTQNLFIEGDNLDALKLLQETYLNKVKMIYIDPPYNTGNDFIYEDDFAEDSESYFERSNQKDEGGNRLVANMDSNGRFHSDWLSMMYSRLKLARNLLRDDGVIFISIDDNEVANLRKICEEVFGSENFLGQVTRVAKTTSFRGNYFAPSKDHILCFSKNILFTNKFSDDVNEEQYTKIEEIGIRKGERYRDDTAFYLTTLETRPNQRYFVKCPDGELVVPPGNTMPPQKPENGDGVWRWSKENFDANKELIVFKKSTRSPLINENGTQAKWNLYTKTYLNDKLIDGNIPRDLFEGFLNRNGSEMLKKLQIPFDFPKPVELISYLGKIMRTAKDDLILDFFSGSCTTAQAVIELNKKDNGNRKFIMVQIPEACDEKSEAFKAGYKTIAEIGKERIRRAGKNIKAENAGKDGIDKLDIGFRVLKIDSSNMSEVYYAPDEVKQGDLLAQINNIREGRTEEDLLFQVLLDWGVDLSLPITHEVIVGKNVFFVDSNALAACFEVGIDESFVKLLAAKHPLRAVFFDASFASDSVKINIEQIFKLISPSTEIKTI